MSRRDSTDMHPTTDPAAAAERARRAKLVDRAAPTQQAITTDTTIFSLAALVTVKTECGSVVCRGDFGRLNRWFC